MQSFKEQFLSFIYALQNEICASLETADGSEKFKENLWTRAEGGGGKTRILSNGRIFEKAGVNTSAVYGELSESLRNYFKIESGDFFACGISLVIHPNNPFVPTVHLNFRYFELYDTSGKLIDQWFGGGTDLTPYYFFKEDAILFHSGLKNCCDKFDLNFYPKYKKECDTYFYNMHRDEARGIGGLFFDNLKSDQNFSSQSYFDLIVSLGNIFLSTYISIVQKRKDTLYTAENKYWQEIRRGRYVEFNLLHDKGTLFGLKTNGRIESIFMSLPPTVRWDYDFKVVPNSEEEKLITILQNPIEYI